MNHKDSMTAKEFREMFLDDPKAAKPNKYKAQRTVYDGVSYAARLEVLRVGQLNLLVKAGEIITRSRQPFFKLGPTEVVYTADFLVVDKDGTIHIEDTKGVEDKRFPVIRKLWASFGKYPLHVLKRKRKRRGWEIEIIEGVKQRGGGDE